MDVEIASITQLTDSVQLAEPQNILSPRLEKDPEAGMDLDCDCDSSRRFSRTHSPGIDVLRSGMPKWGQAINTHSQMGDSEYEAPGTSDEAVLANRITLLPTAPVGDSRGVLHAIFESMEGHEDDADDSEWLDSASVRADTQSVIADDSEDEYDGETGEDDDEMLSGDEVVLAGVQHAVKVWVWVSYLSQRIYGLLI